MAWRETIYVQFPDEETARALAMALGVEFPASGEIPSGNQNYALHAPMQSPWATPPILDAEGMEIEPGIAEPGYWAMIRINKDYYEYRTIMTALQEAGIIREIENPLVDWA